MTDEGRRRPRAQVLVYLDHHLKVRWQPPVCDLLNGETRHQHGPDSWKGLRVEPAADLKPLKLIQVVVGEYRGELQDLIKARVSASSLGIVKDERQMSLQSGLMRRRNRNELFVVQLFFSIPPVRG